MKPSCGLTLGQGDVEPELIELAGDLLWGDPETEEMLSAFGFKLGG